MDLGVSLIRLSPVLHSGRFGEEDTDPPPRLRVRELKGGVVMLGYGGHEAQPQTASRAMARGIQAHESFEDTVSPRLGNSGSVVRYGQLGASVLQPGLFVSGFWGSSANRPERRAGQGPPVKPGFREA